MVDGGSKCQQSGKPPLLAAPETGETAMDWQLVGVNPITRSTARPVCEEARERGELESWVPKRARLGILQPSARVLEKMQPYKSVAAAVSRGSITRPTDF